MVRHRSLLLLALAALMTAWLVPAPPLESSPDPGALFATQRGMGAASDVGLVDPATGEWHLRTAAGYSHSFYFGDPGDVPMMGDWDCDGVDTPGLYRRSDGFVYLRNSNTQGTADIRFFFGDPGDLPLAGDFDGDGCDTVSVYRASESRVFIINALGADEEGLGAAELSYYFGDPGDKPFVGDFDGDGIETVGLHRESTGLVYFRDSHTQGVADHEFIFGDPGDQIVAGDWTGGGIDTPGLFRPAAARFYLRYSNSQGIADDDFGYGLAPMLAVAGAFGLDEPGFAGRSWEITTVAAPVDWGRLASLTFGAHGRPVIAHGSISGFGSLEFALTQCRDSACTNTATIRSGRRVADHTSAITGADGVPLFSFHDEANGTLVMARCTDSTCGAVTYRVLAPQPASPGQPNVGVNARMAVAGDGLPYVLYENATHPEGIWLARCTDTACSSLTTGSRVAMFSYGQLGMAVPPDGLPVIVVAGWELDASFAVGLIRCADAGCSLGTTSILKAWPLGGFPVCPAVTIGSDGRPIVAYADNAIWYEGEPPTQITDHALFIADCLDPECERFTTTRLVEGHIGSLSMDVGGDGFPVLAFQSARGLEVAHCRDAACSSAHFVLVDPNPVVAGIALRIDPFGMPVIAYHDPVGHDLRVARLAG